MTFWALRVLKLHMLPRMVIGTLVPREISRKEKNLRRMDFYMKLMLGLIKYQGPVLLHQQRMEGNWNLAKLPSHLLLKGRGHKIVSGSIIRSTKLMV